MHISRFAIFMLTSLKLKTPIDYSSILIQSTFAHGKKMLSSLLLSILVTCHWLPTSMPMAPTSNIGVNCASAAGKVNLRLIIFLILHA